jgi:hypothetical protein
MAAIAVVIDPLNGLSINASQFWTPKKLVPIMSSNRANVLVNALLFSPSALRTHCGRAKLMAMARLENIYLVGRGVSYCFFAKAGKNGMHNMKLGEER